MKKTTSIFSTILVFAFSVLSSHLSIAKELTLWYDEEAPDSDMGWVNRSIPLGNGYMGVNVFGGTKSERIQITENSLFDGPSAPGLNRKGLS